MTFETESGSVYEFDRAGPRVRKCAGGPGTERVGAGEWRPCIDVLMLGGVGCRALIHWRDLGDRQECTMTSIVVRVADGD